MGRDLLGGTEMNLGNTRKPSRGRQGLCPALKQAARELALPEERKYARWVEGSANALEKRDSACALRTSQAA